MTDKKSIAVLPFVNSSSSSDADYFSDGIAESIINALAKIHELKVTSRTSSFSFKGTSSTISEIAEKLNVAIILEGSIQVSGSTARITTQLIETNNDYNFWSETFDRDLKNIFEVQDEISLLIADKLREHLGHFEVGEHLVDQYNVPLETYKKYLKGRFYLMKLDYSNTLKAIAIFDEVIAESPSFPLPYLDVNQGYAYMGTMGIISAYEGFTKAQPYLERALELNENLPESQLNIAWIECWQKWNLKQAYVHLNQALSIRPTDNMYITMANLLTVEGKLEVAMKYCDKALEIAPFSSVNINYKGFLYYLMGRYQSALPYFKRSLDIQPELPFPVVNIGACYLLMGQHKEGLAYFDNLAEDNTGYLAKLGGTTLAHAIIGNKEKAEVGITELKSYLQSSSAGNAFNFLILCNAQLGNLEVAMDYFQSGIKNHFPMILLLPTEPLAKPLHDIPEFQKSMANIIGRNDNTLLHRKNKKSLFTDKEKVFYETRLREMMEQEQLHLNPALSLRSLAEYMNLSPNHLSQLLNDGFGQNFADFVNGYRLEEFKIKLDAKNAHHLTILAIAYDSGFNSKTVFNTFFKKKMGVTPKAYWHQLNQ
jgi:TolB-like protein/AraC-like DNA-binding protein/Tfp pilus assembly protein PilF